MKKLVSLLVITLLACSMFAANLSYKNNTYQKLADEYTKKAEQIDSFEKSEKIKIEDKMFNEAVEKVYQLHPEWQKENTEA